MGQRRIYGKKNGRRLQELLLRISMINIGGGAQDADDDERPRALVRVAYNEM